MCRRTLPRTSMCFILIAGWTAVLAAAEWQPHTVQKLNGAAPATLISASRQIASQQWTGYNGIFAVPQVVYMPEQQRLAMMVLFTDYPHRSTLAYSDDYGLNWSQPTHLQTAGGGSPSFSTAVGLTYLGQGKLMVHGDDANHWFSQDYGATWGNPTPTGTAPDGRAYYAWDPAFVDRDPQTGAATKLWESNYTWLGGSPGHQQAYLRGSTDSGATWSQGVMQWDHGSEVALTRAANGNLVAAVRTDMLPQYAGQIDHYEGLGVSVSTDDGATWSPINKLYDYGRHHASMVLMPDGDIVMSYVVRVGYPDAPSGFPQFGIEAVVSHDDGLTWDMDHRYILDQWEGNITGPNAWYAGPQGTSSVLLPDGSILTAFGTAYRQQGLYNGTVAPRDVGIVLWHVPEPSTLVLAGTGLLALSGYLRRRERRQKNQKRKKQW